MSDLPEALVLEITKKTDALLMGVFERRQAASTLRHYSQIKVSFPEIEKFCAEINLLLNKADKKGNLEFASVEGLKKTGQLLWDHLFSRQVKEKLTRSSSCDLVLSIDEELVDIPWELLYSGSDFLCLKFSLGRIIRTQDNPQPAQYRSMPSTPRMLILANPTKDLKSAYLEGLFIRNQLDRRRRDISVDFKSTYIDTLYVKKNLRDYDIVHFSGHCEYDQQERENNGWILSDGRLTARDICTLGEATVMPSLIFSHACSSAKFSQDFVSRQCGEKAYSIAWAFLSSGVRHYIGAIRKIEDSLSLTFTQEFYNRMISGKPVGESLRQGRLKLVKEYGISSVSWMSYLLYGDPDFVLFNRNAAPAYRQRVNIKTHKKKILAGLAAITVIAVSFWFYGWIASLNPAAQALYFKAKSSFNNGNNQEAIRLSRQIIEKDPLFLAVYPLLAETYQRAGDRETALKYYFDYAIAAEKRNDKNSLAAAFTWIGWTYHLRGEYPKAFEFYQQAIDLSRRNRDSLNESRAMERLAVWHIDKEEYDNALELLMKSSEINRQRQHIRQYRHNLACDYFDIGLVFVNKNDYQAAREFYEKSRIIFEKMKLRHELSDCYFNLGEIYLYEKEYQKALAYYYKGLALDEELGAQANIASDYNMIGELYVEIDNLRDAEKFFGQAAALGLKIGAKPELAEAYYNLAQVYKRRNIRHRARDYFRQAQEIYVGIDTPRYEKIKQEFLALYSTASDTHAPD